MRKSLTREERLRKASDIKGLFETARRLEGEGLRLLYRQNGAAANRMAVLVSRGCGGAVRRNREKRITREAYRDLKPDLRTGNDLLVIVDRFGRSFSERRAALQRLFARADLRHHVD